MPFGRLFASRAAADTSHPPPPVTSSLHHGPTTSPRGPFVCMVCVTLPSPPSAQCWGRSFLQQGQVLKCNVLSSESWNWTARDSFWQRAGVGALPSVTEGGHPCKQHSGTSPCPLNTPWPGRAAWALAPQGCLAFRWCWKVSRVQFIEQQHMSMTKGKKQRVN